MTYKELPHNADEALELYKRLTKRNWNEILNKDGGNRNWYSWVTMNKKIYTYDYYACMGGLKYHYSAEDGMKYFTIATTKHDNIADVVHRDVCRMLLDHNTSPYREYRDILFPNDEWIINGVDVNSFEFRWKHGLMMRN